MSIIDKAKVNSYLLALYIFQFGFMQPVASLIGSQAPVAVLTLMIVTCLLLVNSFRLQRYVIGFFVVSSIYFLLSALFFSANVNLTLAMYGEFLLKGFSGFFVASFASMEADPFVPFLTVGVFNFCMIGLFPFVNFLSSMNYMRFGYALIPSALVFLLSLYDANTKIQKFIWFVFSVLSLALTLIYGSRGVIIVLFLFVLLIFVFSRQIKSRTKWSLLFCGSISLYFVLRFQLIIQLIDFFYYSIGIQTYSLRKLKTMFLVGLAEASSGRDMIYRQILQLVKAKPFFGYGIGSAQFYLDYTAHNFLLQILLESGLIGLLVWTLIWIRPLKEYLILSKSAPDRGYFRVATLLLASAFGRLMISSDMWLRPEYWFVLSLLLRSSTRRERNVDLIVN